MSGNQQRGRGRGAPRGRGGPPRGASPGGGQPQGGPPRGRGFAGGVVVGTRGGGGGGPRGGGGGGGRGGRAPPEVFSPGSPARLDQRLSTSSDLVAAFKKLEVKPEMPLRPGWGTVGRTNLLRANFFALKLPKNLIIYDYDVAITPNTDLRGPRKGRLLDLLEQTPEYAPFAGYISHDRGERLVSAKKLPQPSKVSITFFDEGQTGPGDRAPVYELEVKLVRTLNSSDVTLYLDGRPESRDYDILPLVSALNLVLQSHASKTGVRVGQNRYFFPSTQRYQLELGIEACQGFFMSVRPSYKQLMVNVNVCMTAFYMPGNLADAMMAFNRESGGMPREFSERLRVATTYLGYLKKRAIFRIIGTNARQTRFDCAELGGTVTVEKYFKDKYKIILKHPELPLVNLSGDRNKPNYVPPELCDILPNQAYRGTLSPNATAQMIQVACNPPAANASSIVSQGLPLLGLHPTAQANILTNFAISVSPDMACVPSRVLPAPRVTYKSGQPNVRDGSWNILGVKFHAGGDMTNWAVLLVQEGRRDEFRDASDPALTAFLKTFEAKCRSSGMVVGQGQPRIMVTPRLPSTREDPSRQRALTLIQNTLGPNSGRKPSFILVLLSGVDKYIYPGLKKMCDMSLGVHTVCMLLSKARQDKRQDQYFSNVALKVNAKLGGTNHLLAPESMQWLTTKKTMLVGIDVTHPSPGSMPGTPSIAAVVASIDDKFVQFPGSLEPQRNRKIKKDAEEGLATMMVERLQLYEKKSRTLPERVIVYRDGVSEGQFHLVLEKELPQILSAFRQFDTRSRGGPYRPTLSIIICGKRHHARFNATATDHMSRNGNTPPGTVVDQGITDIYNNDFYLQAHDGLQGHVRATHYTVVYDENKLTADTIQTGTNSASYMYARATKAVSLIPPAYYADLACERARAYLSVLLSGNDNRSSSSQDAERERIYQEALTLWGRGIHQDMKESMFYI
ncbi:hypothetical protein BOTBODRAFT_117083 [Botryobasidium botryosum FD-172 SS1]|uniref:Piwi domain-containing protein n=1 Tax=Botryobasidium botryosum (strain FD-172 SS1) TaxID=930990 RepID=A0A067M1W5_BOTB1|nr:hypothetical protein BOTBODRAFT_117083 [Botryobasidium botryosum FD-172 SS1]